MGSAEMAGVGVVSIVYILILAIYLLPSIIALIKKNRRTKVILFNIFLGWTFVMWIVSLVWACKRVEPATPAAEPAPEPDSSESAE